MTVATILHTQQHILPITSRKFKTKEIILINGIGVNLEKFKKQTVDRKAKLRKGNSPQNPKGPFSTIKK